MDRLEKYIDIFQPMIRMETISGKGELTKFYEFHELLRNSFPHIFAEAEVMDFNGSLLLKWKGTDDEKKPVLFMNHMDVVEASGPWEYDPFGAEIHDGRIYGRGTIDTKTGLFGMLKAADELAEEGFKPAADVYFESACNEETTGAGAEEISRWMFNNGIELDKVYDEGGFIMDDPIGGADGTFAMVGVAEKGCCDLKFIARSEGGHAAMPPKNTPLVRLGKFMAEIDDKYIFERELSEPVKELFRRIAPYMGKAGVVLSKPERFEGLIDTVLPRLSDTAGAMLGTTIAFTMAGGSEGLNVLPQEAYVTGNMRFSHHEGRNESISKVAVVAAKYDIDIEILDPGFSSDIADYDGEAFKLIEEGIKAVFPEVDEVLPFMVTGASDARYFNRVCDQCLRFLPILIDDSQMSGMHGNNENVTAAALVTAVDFYKYMIKGASI